MTQTDRRAPQQGDGDGEHAVGERDAQAERVAAVLYALTFMTISITLRLLWFYAADERRLLRADVSDDQVAARNFALTPVLAFYAIAVVVALVLPRVAVAVLLVAVVYQGIPSRTVYRSIRRRRGAASQT